ncbi:MAG: hypothetical protein ACREX9_17385, partial [Gammaproteobacteria bacterium]
GDLHGQEHPRWFISVNRGLLVVCLPYVDVSERCPGGAGKAQRRRNSQLTSRCNTALRPQAPLPAGQAAIPPSALLRVGLTIPADSRRAAESL